MLLKKLTLSNFRQFKEKETVEFSQDQDANITLILGDNTSGKTTILQSFLWCFYGKANFNRRDQLYNEENAREMREGQTKDVEVTVELEHDDIDFIIERKQLCEKQKNTTRLIGQSRLRIFHKNSLGEREEVDPIDVFEVMSDILPEDLAEYFFYDTERFGNITEKNDVTKAVKGLLGLTILENALDHLGRRTRSDSVVGGFYNDLNHNGNQDINRIKREIDQVDQKITNSGEQIEKLETELSNYKERLSLKEEQLRALAATMELQRTIDYKREEIKRNKIEITNSNGRFLKDFQNGPLNYFMNPLILEAQVLLANTEVEDEFIRGIDASSINDIITRGYCVCGTEVKEGSEEYGELQKALEVIPPQSIGVMVNNYQNLLRANMNKGNNFFSTLTSTYERITKLKMENDNLNHEITRLQERIKGIDNAKNLQAEVEDIRNKIQNIDRRIFKLEYDRKKDKEKLDKLQNNLAAHLRISEHNKEVLTLLKYAEKVTEWFQVDYDRKNLEIRSLLEEKVNYYFKSIYHGNRRVKIDDRYRVTLYSTTSDYELVTDESAGLETVKNFAFIAGLVDLAKQRLEENNKRMEEEIEYGVEEDYPLVLDAPFSNVDEKHVLNISKVLPTVAGQLILIVMDKDWNYAADELQSKVGKMYRLEKKSELYTKLREF